jgi:hypothetical protein
LHERSCFVPAPFVANVAKSVTALLCISGTAGRMEGTMFDLISADEAVPEGSSRQHIVAPRHRRDSYGCPLELPVRMI